MDSLLTIDTFIAIGVFMATPWVVLALFSALADAGVGFVDEWMLKEVSEEDSALVDAPGRLVLISGFFGFAVALGAALYALIPGDSFTLFVDPASLLLAIAAGVLEVVWLIPYFYALDRGGAVNTTPLFQTIPIFSLIIGLLFFAEVPLISHIIATATIIGGAVLLNYSPQTKRIDVRAIMLMLSASFVISLGFFLFKDASLGGNFVAALFGNGLGMGFLSAGIWLFYSPYREQFNTFLHNGHKRIYLLQVGNESLYTIGAITNQMAIVLGPSVMVVSAFNAFHPIFTLMISFTLAQLGFKSQASRFYGPQLRLKTIAILMIAFGTLLLAQYL